MSIYFNIGRNPNPDYVHIDSEFTNVRILKNLISKKVGILEGDMKIKNVISNIEYAPNQYIKKGSSVSIDITAENLTDEPIRFHEIISNERLEAMMEDCRFYMVKSSNEDNVQRARDGSVWATTMPNQDKFKTAFQCFKHVFLLFGTNRSQELKGLARMQSEPDRVPDKSLWNGVNNIRLGGNFKIRWIRKKPLSFSTIDKKLGSEYKDEIVRSTDGYQPDPLVAKRVALLFELPSEPYYSLEQLMESKKQRERGVPEISKPIAYFNAQLASLMMKNLQESANIDKLGIDDPISPPKKENFGKQKSKKKKSKKSHRRRHSSSSSRSYSSRSRSSSRGRR